MSVSLPDLDPADDTIVVDPSGVLDGVDVTANAPDTPPGCMSAPDDPDCDAVLRALGLRGASVSQSLVRGR